MSMLQDLEKTIFPSALLHAAGVPSASIAVLSNGKISSHVITTGSEDPDTIYQACSISKAITGIAAARLVEQGKLSYSTPVADHLPQKVVESLVDKKTAHLFPLVTVGMLLSHTAGLSQGGFAGYESDPPSAEVVLSGEPPSNTPQVRFLTFPGAQFSYSGGGFTVLQVFLESLLGKPFAQVMQETVLQPLGMTRSHYGDLAEREKNYTDAHHTAYTRARAGHHILPEQAAAALWTTPSDLMRAIAAVQQSLHSDDGFLKPETAKLMLKPLVAAFSDNDFFSHGWSVTDTTFGHGGSNEPGYRCVVIGSHDGSIDTSAIAKDSTDKDTHPSASWGPGDGVAIMTNSALGWPVCIKILDAISYLRGWPRLPNVPWPRTAGIPCATPPSTAIPDGWEAWIGRWDDGWRLEDRDGVPVLGFKDAGEMELRLAAAPARVLEAGRREICLVVVGLEMMVELTWEGEEKVLRWAQWKEKVLRRV